MNCMFQIHNSPELLFIDCFVCFETEYIFNIAVWITVHLECQNVPFHEGHLFLASVHAVTWCILFLYFCNLFPPVTCIMWVFIHFEFLYLVFLFFFHLLL